MDCGVPGVLECEARCPSGAAAEAASTRGRDVSDTCDAGVPDEAVLRRMFEIVTAISRTDAAFRKLLLAGQARSTYYSPKGQECISAGVSALLRRDDYVVTTYRGLHDHLAKGVPMRELF